MRSRHRTVFELVLLSVISVGSSYACGQEYPNKHIRIITGPTAGAADLVTRLVASGLSAAMGQQAIIDNRASTVGAGEFVAKAPPDGYTLMSFPSSMWLLPFLQDGVPFDPLKDFAPIALIAGAPTILVVHPSFAAKSVKELISYAKAKPGVLNYSSGLSGAAPHLAAELFKAMAGVDIVRIAYKGGAPAVTALIGGEVQLSFATAGSVMSIVKSGKLRALAVTSAKPSLLLPGMPTVAASGVPGYEAVSTYGMLAPAKTPVAIVRRLNQELVRMLANEEIRDKFFNSGLETAGGTPEEFRAAMQSEMSRMGKIIKEAGITGD